MKIIFMGTPDFAVTSLDALVKAGHDISLVITQPDRPKGRGQKLAASEVKLKALELGLPVHQPESLRTPEFHEIIKNQNADLMVVVAFRILPDSLFPLTRFGAVNVHGSLLPKYRGAAPIPWAIAQGDRFTGVTVFQLDQQIDHGQILAQTSTPIGEFETAGELYLRLKELGKDALLDALEKMQQGKILPLEQSHAEATPAPKLKKEDGLINWTLPARTLFNRLRAFNPYPIGFTHIGNMENTPPKTLRISRAQVVDEQSPGPGKVLLSADRFPLVGCGDVCLKLLEVQPEGKPKMAANDFWNGLQNRDAIVLG